MRTETGKNWGLRATGFLFTFCGLLASSASLAAQPPQAQPVLPPAYVPPAPVIPAPPPAYVAPAGGPVIPAPPPPPSEGVGFPGQPAAPPGSPALVAVDPAPPTMFFVPRPRFDANDPYRIWVRTDLLLWWVKNAPFNAQVVASPESFPTSGTVVTPSNLDYGTMAGFRFVMGGWFDSNNVIGMEGGFFTTEHTTRNYSYSSDANGNPTLAYAFVNQTPGFAGMNLMPISQANGFAGNVLIAPSMQLWGAEINGALNLWRSAGTGTELTLLGGFRYANLQESLMLSALTQMPDGSVMINNDNFGTRNQFFGGQLGARFGWQSDRLSVDVTGKLAIGGTAQSVDIQGNTFTNFGGVPSVTPGGFYAQQSNSGHFTGTSFSVMPTIELKLSYALSSRTRLYLGYDFMYWNEVVRPGSQINNNINLSQSPSLGNGALSGSATPTPLFNRTDFWAQGLNFGVEFRF